MKTTKIISALSLALILFGATTFAGNVDKTKAAGSAVTVRYAVTVNLATDKPICNIYQVEMLDASGRLVAPAQYYVQGKESYTFYEQTRQSSGVRIARLVLAPNLDRFACEQELFTAPDAKLISFTNSETYLFNLAPVAKPSKITD